MFMPLSHNDGYVCNSVSLLLAFTCGPLPWRTSVTLCLKIMQQSELRSLFEVSGLLTQLCQAETRDPKIVKDPVLFPRDLIYQRYYFQYNHKISEQFTETHIPGPFHFCSFWILRRLVGKEPF